MKGTSPPLPAHLQHYMEQNVGKPPIWSFPDLVSSENLRFHRLDFDNRHRVLDMFRNDPSPFVEDYFKTEEALYEYVASLWIAAPYSRKRGGIDWLIQRESGEWVGLLHAFDCSKENYGFRRRHCTIGFCVGESHRGTGIAREAVEHLQSYLFRKMDMLYVLAYTKKENEQCIRFLEKLEYEDASAAYGNEESAFYRRYRSARARSIILSNAPA